MAIVMHSDGTCAPDRARAASVPDDEHIVCEVIAATAHHPETALSARARPFDIGADDAAHALQLPLPGAFGAALLLAPVWWTWDHAATMEVADLDRLLTSCHAASCRAACPGRAHADRRIFARAGDGGEAGADEDVAVGDAALDGDDSDGASDAPSDDDDASRESDDEDELSAGDEEEPEEDAAAFSDDDEEEFDDA